MRTPVLVLLLVGCAPRAYDNRPADRVLVVHVGDDGRIALADGRVVRLFGVALPQRTELRVKLVRRLADDLVGKEVTVDELLPGAVELTVWQRAFLDGVWTRGVPGYHGRPVAINLPRHAPVVPNERDLRHPDAPAWVVKSMREDFAQRHGDLQRVR